MVPAVPLLTLPLLSFFALTAWATQPFTKTIQRRWVLVSEIRNILHHFLPLDPSLTHTIVLHDQRRRQVAEEISTPTSDPFIAAAMVADQTGDILGGKVIFIATQTEETGPAPTGEGGAQWVQIIETSTDIPSSLGTMTEKCMILAEDQSQRFCSTTLNGQIIGNDSGLQLPPDNSSESVQSSASTTTTSSSTTSAPAISTSPADSSSVPASLPDSITSPSSSTTLNSDLPAATSTSIFVDVVVNDSSSSTSSSSGMSTTAEVAATSMSTESALPGSTTLSSIPVTTETASTGADSNTVSASAEAPSAVSSGPPSGASTTASATAASAEESNSTVEIPGQKLSVLPIGLGVFGGLAAITLGIVGYVLWERKKYRLQFRRRRDAEKGSGLSGQGTAMGTYGSA